MTVRSIAVVSLAVLVVGGCGGESSAAALGDPVEYARGGGLAGVRDDLTLRPDGRARVSTRKGHRSFRLSKGERRRVEKALQKADLAHVKVKHTAAVPDAFGYRISYRSRHVEFNDANLPEQVADLVSALDALVADHGPR